MPTNNSVYNSDSDSRQFTITINFLVPLLVTVRPILAADFRFTVDEVLVKTEQGTHEITIAKNGQPLFAGNITVGTTGTTHIPNQNNVFVEDDQLAIAYSSLNAPLMSVVQINCTRDYTA